MDQQSTVTLYHGTSTEHLPQILESGIHPRSHTGQQSNYPGEVESKPDFVYLSSAYPVYFAAVAARDPFDLAVCKVKVRTSHLFPDEDFIGYAIAKQDGLCWSSIIPDINPVDYKPYWKESLDYNGNVATPSVPPASILEHRTIAADDMQLILATGGDSMPSVMNYTVMGSYYRRILDTFFADGKDAALDQAHSSRRWR